MTRAAEELGYVPSAISQHVTSLERSLGGTVLFTRRAGSRLTLTAEGRALVRAADELLAAAAVFGDTAQRVSRGEGVSMRIGAYATALTHLLPPVFKRMVAADGVSSIRTVEVEPAAGLSLLERGELDALIAHRYLPEHALTGRDLNIFLLGSESMQLVSAASGPLRTLQDCAGMDWVAGRLSHVDRQLLQRWAAEVGIAARVRHETRDCTTAAELIAADLAVGLLPASVVNADGFRGRMRVVQFPKGVPTPSREVIAMTRSNLATPLIMRMLKEVEQALHTGSSDSRV